MTARVAQDRPQSSGFTLLEVIVAFVIMALVFGAVFNTFSIGLRNAKLSGDYTNAVVHAEAKLALLGVADSLDEGVREGTFGSLYRWRQSIRPITHHAQIETGDPSHQLYEVTLTVFWGRGPEARELTLRTLRVRADRGI